MYYLDTRDGGSKRFRNAVLVAIALHVTVALGVSFSPDTRSEYSHQIEVTLATQPSAFVPVEANRLAQSNQLGSGEASSMERISRPRDMPADTSAEQLPPKQGATQHHYSEQSPVSTSALSRPAVSGVQDRNEQDPSLQKSVNPEFERISREIAGLQAELDQESKTSADQQRVRRLDSSTAKQSVDAAYLLDWRRRLESVGNQYYPKASVRYGLFGDVRMLVVIRQDGSLEDIQVLSSSGYAVLDEAAIKIVRMAAPYSPFPQELKATTDKLEIVRTWHFQENPLSSY
ncbi:MAG: energy transducer TonB [Halioglobus sp.]|nr:energy transducer TonB [Halioglobus sp.]